MSNQSCLTVPIRIDETVKYLLEFARTSCIPQVIRRNQQWSSDKRERLDRRQPPSNPHEVNEDLCLGYLFLARYAALAASLEQHEGRNAIACMKYKGTALTLLRSRITDIAERSDLRRTDDRVVVLGANPLLSQICWLIYLLSTVELSARNYDAAALHTRMILRFLASTNPTARAVLRLEVINAISFWDVQRASITLTRPCFNPDQWASTHPSISWQSLVDLEIPPSAISARSSDIAAKLSDKMSAAWPFVTLRECRKIARTLPLIPADNHSEQLRLHFSFWNSVHEAKLLNDFLDLPQDCDNLTGLAAVYLSSLYWKRRLVSSESVGPSKLATQGTTLYEAGPVILKALNAILDREQLKADHSNLLIAGVSPRRSSSFQNQSSTGALYNNDSRLRLWVLYVAAMAERANTAFTRPQRFSVEFLTQASAMRFRSWSQVRDEVLRTFLYDEELDPVGDSWYEHVVGASLRQLHFF